MLVWALVATGLLLLLAVCFAGYSLQMRRSCREIRWQLEFLSQNRTNLRITGCFPHAEMQRLADSINQVIDKATALQQQVQHGDRELRETVASLSHDIRTPLTSLDGYFQLLSDGQSDEEKTHYLAVIRQRISCLEDMLEELFTYAKLQDSGFHLEIQPVDLGNTLLQALFSFYDEFENRNRTPEIDFPEQPIHVLGNKEALHRLLQNVVTNALEHGQGPVRLSLHREQEQAVFCCANKVEHPEQVDMERVFSRFYKADSSRSHTSTGLGLSIAKGLAEHMQGSVQATLDGDIFTVRFVFPLCEDG